MKVFGILQYLSNVAFCHLFERKFWWKIFDLIGISVYFRNDCVINICTDVYCYCLFITDLFPSHVILLWSRILIHCRFFSFTIFILSILTLNLTGEVLVISILCLGIIITRLCIFPILIIFNSSLFPFTGFCNLEYSKYTFLCALQVYEYIIYCQALAPNPKPHTLLSQNQNQGALGWH